MRSRQTYRWHAYSCIVIAAILVAQSLATLGCQRESGAPELSGFAPASTAVQNVQTAATACGLLLIWCL
jgi:hypothetical protein